MRPEPKETPAASPAPATAPAFAQRLYRDANETMKPWVNVLGLALIAAQFWLVLRILDRFKLENDAFRAVMLIAFGGFIVHHLLPLKLRLPFFVTVSLVTIGYVLGMDKGVWVWSTALSRSGILLAIGGALIGICHLPLHFYARVAILVAVAAGLVVFRAGWVEFAPLGPIWPVLGAMFMFRLAVYIYDLQHEKERPKLSRTLAYFFMLPNVCFPLFPVVDYKTFARNYYNEEVFQAYQRGVTWMARGAIQLVLWRLVYYHMHVGPNHVQDGTDLIRFLLSNVLLYLRVSGEFHLVIGLLHLFGFNLPETNKRYFLAASFTDYWRRVNIYWKDFIMKIVFYPAIFRMKAWNQTTAMIVATAFAFVVTWALHSYQWFWLRGQFPLVLQDCIFWATLGVLVVFNTLREQKKGRQRAIVSKGFDFKETFILSLKTCAIFTTMTILWSFWNCDSVPHWISVWSNADLNTLLYGLLANLVIMAATFIFEGGLGKPAPAPKPKLGAAKAPKIIPIFPAKAAALTVVLPILVVFAATSNRLVAKLGPSAESVVQSLASSKPNQADQAEMERGYYEDLMDVSRFNSALAESLTKQPADWKKIEDTNAVQPTSDHRMTELVPNLDTVVNGKRIRTNRWGMRDDRDYDLERPAGTYRVVMLGSSHLMGWGAPREALFEALMEERMNKELAGKPWDGYELLNFGVNGYSPICQVTYLKEKGLRFHPDAVWFIAHSNDPYWAMQRLGKSYRKGVPPPYPFLQELAKKVELDERTPEMWAQRKLTPHWPAIVGWAYEEIAKMARDSGAQPVWIFMPGILERGPLSKDSLTLVELAKRAGFHVMLLPPSIYDNVPPDQLAIAPWDAHPNERGHKLLADGFYSAVIEDKNLTLHTRSTRSVGTGTSTTTQEKQGN
jgi:hypothetical protein